MSEIKNVYSPPSINFRMFLLYLNNPLNNLNLKIGEQFWISNAVHKIVLCKKEKRTGLTVHVVLKTAESQNII